MEQSNTERPALGPARLRLKVSEDICTAIPATFGNDQNTDHNS